MIVKLDILSKNEFCGKLCIGKSSIRLGLLDSPWYQLSTILCTCRICFLSAYLFFVFFIIFSFFFSYQLYALYFFSIVFVYILITQQIFEYQHKLLHQFFIIGFTVGFIYFGLIEIDRFKYQSLVRYILLHDSVCGFLLSVNEKELLHISQNGGKFM